jgi:hypothetical protein
MGKDYYNGGNEIEESGNSFNVNVAINETEITLIIVVILILIRDDDGNGLNLGNLSSNLGNLSSKVSNMSEEKKSSLASTLRELLDMQRQRHQSFVESLKSLGN